MRAPVWQPQRRRTIIIDDVAFEAIKCDKDKQFCKKWRRTPCDVFRQFVGPDEANGQRYNRRLQSLVEIELSELKLRT
jgi:hypothetical protein